MKYILVTLFGFLSCSSLGQTEILPSNHFLRIYADIDTGIKKTNPEALDLSQPQVYIDTSRTHWYQKDSINWNPLNFKDLKHITQEYFSNDTFPVFHKIDLKNFPRVWVVLKKYRGELILYDGCDYDAVSYGISDSVLFVFQGHEPFMYKILEINWINQKSVSLMIENSHFEEKNGALFFTIQKSEIEHVYVLNTNLMDEEVSQFVASRSSLKMFDVMVNHCPIEKVPEIDHFLD